MVSGERNVRWKVVLEEDRDWKRDFKSWNWKVMFIYRDIVTDHKADQKGLWKAFRRTIPLVHQLRAHVQCIDVSRTHCCCTISLPKTTLSIRLVDSAGSYMPWSGEKRSEYRRCWLQMRPSRPLTTVLAAGSSPAFANSSIKASSLRQPCCT